MIHDPLESVNSVFVNAWHHDDQVPARPQFRCPQRKEGLPVLRPLTIEFGPYCSGACEHRKMIWNHRGIRLIHMAAYELHPMSTELDGSTLP